MYASIRRYRGDASQMDEMLRLVDREFAEQIQEIDGFVAYECIDSGDGQLCTISVFRDREAAEQSVIAAASWIKDSLSQFTLERTDVFTGEVSVSRARREMLEPAHA
jgi:hypothetical protein